MVSGRHVDQTRISNGVQNRKRRRSHNGCQSWDLKPQQKVSTPKPGSSWVGSSIMDSRTWMSRGDMVPLRTHVLPTSDLPRYGWLYSSFSLCREKGIVINTRTPGLTARWTKVMLFASFRLEVCVRNLGESWSLERWGCEAGFGKERLHGELNSMSQTVCRLKCW